MKIPQKGVYVFYEESKPLYVGRSDDLRTRIRNHGQPSSKKGSATFAYNLTRDEWGIWKGPYWDGPMPKKKEERDKVRQIKKGIITKKVQLIGDVLLTDKEISEDFKSQVTRVKKMQVRALEINDEYEQAIFEVYAAKALNTRYNDFKPH